MDAVMWEESIMGELIRLIREELVNVLGPKLGLGLGPHLLPVLQATLAQETANRQIHRVIGRDHIHAPNMDFLLEQPIADAEVRTGMALDVALFVTFRTEESVPVPAGVDEEDVALADVGSSF